MEGKIDKFKSEIEELGFSVDHKTSSQKFVYFDCTKNWVKFKYYEKPPSTINVYPTCFLWAEIY